MQVGEKYLDALRVVKKKWDPAGVCNPGVLVPPKAAVGGSIEAVA